MDILPYLPPTVTFCKTKVYHNQDTDIAITHKHTGFPSFTFICVCVFSYIQFHHK